MYSYLDSSISMSVIYRYSLIIFFNVSYIYQYVKHVKYVYRFDVSSLQLKENKLLIHKMLHTLRVDWEIEFVAAHAVP